MRQPLQNRVTPFGEIVAAPHRGALMGNRGCLHDDDRRIIRHSARDAWISCRPAWPGIRRQLMRPGYYTELFFLDEATALAAGHRPCGSCRPERLDLFKQAWARAYGLAALPTVAAIDRKLRRTPALAERGALDPDHIPDGAMVTVLGSREAWLKSAADWYRWSFAGYERATDPPAARVIPLTPPPLLATISEGYAPEAAIG